MQNLTDAELLHEYATRKSESAFGEIVRRYTDFVYSAALRQVRDPELARDVAQTVFADLARKAGSLREGTLLIGWLCRGARLAALEQLRHNSRRRQRERQAMELIANDADPSNDWPAIRPVLDEAIASLGSEDRDALLLRYFKNENLAAVGATLGVSEDAAQKRVSRALDKLRDFLGRRGITTTAAALSVVLTANAVQAAPAGFTVSLTAAALAKAIATPILPFWKPSLITPMKTTLLVTTLTGGIAGLVYYQSITQHRLHEAQARLQSQADEIATLRAANEQLARQTNELEPLRAQSADLLRLRAEVTQLRHKKTNGTAAQPAAATEADDATNPPPPTVLTRSKFAIVPDKYLADISAAWTPISDGCSMCLMASPQVEAIDQAMKGAEDVRILGSPRIQTAMEKGMGVSMMHREPFGETNVIVGPLLKVIPHASTNSYHIGLEAVATMKLLVDTSPQQDGTQPVLQTVTVSNSLTILDGQTLVLQRPLPEGNFLGKDFTNIAAGPKSLLIFITPNIIHTNGDIIRLQSVIRRIGTN